MTAHKVSVSISSMKFYDTYSYEHPSPHDQICTVSRGIAAFHFVQEHPHLKRAEHLGVQRSWKKNFQQNWHIHSKILEQALRKVVALKKIDITVEETDLAFCIYKYRTMLGNALEAILLADVA
tara:strand:+ start:4644 stop:5012 length:369 start_codon:yes stop_codon:yes gene_type:complete